MNASYCDAAGYTISLFVRRTGQLKRSVEAVVGRCHSSPSFGTSVGGIQQHPMRMCMDGSVARFGWRSVGGCQLPFLKSK